MTHERLLVLAMRFIGVLALFAIPAGVLLPFEWMAFTHRLLGLGRMPDGAIVSYLARSLSAFYAAHGALVLFISCDVHRYWPLVRFWALVLVTMGAVLLVVDAASGLPLWWTLSEGPFSIAFGLVVLWLHARAGEPEP